ncbi:MAG TPA: dihydroorotase [Gemmataceae bacterium]|jgi:dihydroorotase|nr:dihydroorotase [Gemmataceae bacterium]
MNRLRITNGRLVDSAQELDRVDDLWIEGDQIVGIGPRPGWHADRTIDAAGMVVCAGLIDMHVHLREPGQEEDETIATGVASALAGGITTVACMPNTEPALDNQAAAEFVYLQAERAGGASVYPIGAITKGRLGQELAEIGGLVDGGAVAFTDHDRPIVSADIMRRALEYCRMFDKPVLCHAEDPELTRGGIMHEGALSMRLGLRGMPAAAEEIVLYRDLELAQLTGGRLHVLHVSTAGSVELIRRAKERGIRVTAETTPQHLLLTDAALQTFDSNYKTNPPLRTRADAEALIEGLVDGTIDTLVSDHSPLASEKKQRELDQAPFGIVGLETLLPLAVTALIEPGRLTWPKLVDKLARNPARILGLDGIGTLQPGTTADVTVLDPKVAWKIDPTRFASKSGNSPFAGFEVKGRAHMTIVGGEVSK